MHNGLVHIEPPDCLTPRFLTVRGYKKFCPRIDFFKSSFPRMINLWNALPNVVVGHQTLTYL